MNSKCFHLFSFNTYEHNVYIKKFRFFQFQFITFNNLTHWKQKSYFPKITSFRWSPFRSKALSKPLANVTHYSLKHLHKNSFDFLLNLMFQLLNCVGCWCFEDLRFQIAPEKEITCCKIGWPGWPCDVPTSGDNMVRKQIPHSCHGISCGVARNAILLKTFLRLLDDKQAQDLRSSPTCEGNVVQSQLQPFLSHLQRSKDQ